MPDMTPAPRRRPLWRLFIMPALLLIAAALERFLVLCGVEVGVRADAWRAQEAKSGRVYDCGKRSVAGYPFRLEVRCERRQRHAGLADRGRAAAPFTAQLGEILVVAQIYQPKLLIAEFKAPATIAERGQPPSMKVNWSWRAAAFSACRRAAARLDRVRRSLDRSRQRTGADAACARQACRTAWPVRGGIGRRHPVIETALQIAAAPFRSCIRCWRRRSMPTCRPSSAA